MLGFLGLGSSCFRDPLFLWLLGMTPSKALTMLTAQTCVSARDGLEGWFPSSVHFAVCFLLPSPALS